MAECKHCGREHEPVSFDAWAWHYAELQPKPKGIYGSILLVAARMLNTKTGCGKLTSRQVAEKHGDVTEPTVDRALSAAQKHGLFLRTARGHNIDGTEAMPSQYQLLRATQPARGRRFGSKPNPREDAGSIPPNLRDGASEPARGVGPDLKALKAVKADRSDLTDVEVITKTWQEVHGEALSVDAAHRVLAELKRRTKKIGVLEPFARSCFKKDDGTLAQIATGDCGRCGGKDGEHVWWCDQQRDTERRYKSWETDDDQPDDAAVAGCCDHRSKSHGPTGCSECAAETLPGVCAPRPSTQEDNP